MTKSDITPISPGPLPAELEAVVAADREIPEVPSDVRARLEDRLKATLGARGDSIREPGGSVAPRAGRGRSRIRTAGAGLLGAAIVSLAAAATWILWPSVAGPGDDSDALEAERRQTIAIGAHARAIAEAGAVLSWRIAEDGATTVEQRAGNVLYHVAAGAKFVVRTSYGNIESLGTTFRVEMNTMPESQATKNKTLKRSLVAAAAVAVVAVTVYKGRVLIGDDGGRAEVRAGEQATLPVGASPPGPTHAMTASAPESEPPPLAVPVAYGDDPRGDLRLEGQVIDNDELPVAGAVVTISSRPAREVETEEDGSFAIDGLLPRPYTVRAKKGNLYAGPVTARLSDSSAPVILRVRQGSTLEISVVDAERRHPIAGAAVRLTDVATAEAASDSRGIARFDGVGPGAYEVRVRATGFAPSARRLGIAGEMGSLQRETIVLERGALVTGRVVDAHSVPVAGAEVSARRISRSFFSSGSDESVTTDARGHFEFPALMSGSYVFTASKQGFADGKSEVETIDGSSPRRGIRIAVQPGRAISGRVVTDAGEPVPHASVRVAEVGVPSIRASIRELHADDSGAFLVDGLPEKEIGLLAIDERGSSERVTVDLSARTAGSGPREVRLVLEFKGTIAGRVVDPSGEPIADAQVAAMPATLTSELSRSLLRRNALAVTDPDGRFAIHALAPGEYRVKATRPGDPASSWFSPFSEDGVVAEPGQRDLRIVVPENGTISGKVVRSDGKSPEIFSISVDWGQPVPFAGSDGEFRLTQIAPGTHRLRVSGPKILGHETEVLEVRPGENTDAGTIVLATGRTLRGRVTAGDGSPVAGASVVAGRFLMGDGKNLNTSLMKMEKETITAEDGSFSIYGVGNLPLVIGADHLTHGQSSIGEVAAGVDDVKVDLVLVRPGTLSGVVTRGGEPLAAMVTAKPQGIRAVQYMVNTGADGRYRFDRLPPGRYGLEAKELSGTMMIMAGMAGDPLATADVAPGASTTADIEMPVGVTLEVEVKSKDGKAASATVSLYEGQVAATTGEELATVTAAVRRAPYLSMAGGRALPATFSDVPAGDYTACATLLPEMEPTSSGGGHIEVGEMSELPVVCAPVTVTASPARQSLLLTH